MGGWKVVTTLNRVVREFNWLMVAFDVHSDPISLVCGWHWDG